MNLPQKANRALPGARLRTFDRSRSGRVENLVFEVLNEVANIVCAGTARPVLAQQHADLKRQASFFFVFHLDNTEEKTKDSFPDANRPTGGIPFTRNVGAKVRRQLEFVSHDTPSVCGLAAWNCMPETIQKGYKNFKPPLNIP